ncbi:MAG: P83/100 family protein, partial [Spirochaetales bacterium]|nr:P83/100 family protein [Spirochaetales bacterium]
MKKIIALFFLIPLTVFAQSVSEEELKSVGDRSGEIVFENYVGPTDPEDFNTRDQISGIGSFLASQEGDEISYGNKYKIVRSWQPEIPEGLDGDILFILPDAAVDHVRNLRSIIASYLKTTFGYSDSNAAVLAEFVTYYNAVYYQDLNHFTSRYKDGVTAHLEKSNAGLSTHYSEWAGKSRIVIPLKSGSGSVQSSLDTSTISEQDVIEEMQKEEDKALDSRREMVEIREEELDQRQEEVDEQRQVVEEKEAEVQEKESVIEKELEEKQEELEQAEEGSPEEEILKEEVEQLEEEKAAVEEEKAAVEEEKAEVEEKQEQIDKEQKEVVTMREEIAKDENELAKEEGVILSTGEEAPQGYWFILVDKSADPASFGSLVKVTKSGQILMKSELNSVRGTGFLEDGEGLIVIAGRNEERSRVKALILDPETLEIIKEGSEEIYPGSSIWTE